MNRRDRATYARILELVVSLEDLDLDGRVTVAGSLWMTVLHEAMVATDAEPVQRALVLEYAGRLREAMVALQAARPEVRDALAEYFCDNANGRPS